jgi:hypothetical protein
LAEPTAARLDLDDAANFILLFLKDPAVKRHIASYGDPGYDVFLTHLIRAYLVHTVPSSQLQLEPMLHQRRQELEVFLDDAAWQLCRRGILRPGVRDLQQQGNSHGHAGQGFSLTSYGRAWIAAANPELIPTQPGRFGQLLVKASPRFGPGFLERSQEASASYQGGTYLACCTMCGAAGESILLAIAIKKAGDEKAVINEYASAFGRSKIIRRVLSGRSQPVQEELTRYMELLKYWRDAAAHGRATHITETEAYTSLVLLLRFALFTTTAGRSLRSSVVPSRPDRTRLSDDQISG